LLLHYRHSGKHAMARAGYLIDERFRLHVTGISHQESPERLTYIQQAVGESGAAERWQHIKARHANLDQLLLVHPQAHVDRVRRAAEMAPSFLDRDTPVSAGSFDAALLAIGGVLSCVDAIINRTVDCAFSFVRPPGHHAEPERAMGFCLFNNVALGAAYLRSEYKLERIAIVDFDVHHGNGTQACFYDDPGVLFISSHQYPYYPGTGDFSQVGMREGWGYTLNFPLPAGTGDEAFIPIYSKIVAPILDQYHPQFILVSAGFDAFFGDPLGGMAVTAAGFASVAASLLRCAQRCCDGRICFVLEGGYSPTGLRESVKGVMAQMESSDPQELTAGADPLFDMISKRAQGEFGEHWTW
jgi:acetoin utilization deacetylase AcuC-like enzyme